MKLFKTLTVVAVLVLLTACSHENPMKAIPSDDVGKFLSEASWHAEKAQNVRNAPGYYYEKCLMHDKSVKLDCAALYQHMLDEAHSTFQFHGVTIADLQDLTFFYRIKDDYHGEAFMINPSEDA